MSIGVYCIRNTINNKVYIGQSINIEGRWRDHSRIEGEVKSRYTLSKAFKKYGLDNFEFIILETCTTEELDNLEIQWIKLMDSTSSSKGYNLNTGGGSMRGYRHTDEAKQKLRNFNLGKTISDITRQKFRKAQLGKVVSEETRFRMSAKGRGHPTSEETKAKISAAKKGKKLPPRTEETRQKMSAARKSKIFSEETRSRMVQSSKARSSEHIKLAAYVI